MNRNLYRECFVYLFHSLHFSINIIKYINIHTISIISSILESFEKRKDCHSLKKYVILNCKFLDCKKFINKTKLFNKYIIMNSYI